MRDCDTGPKLATKVVAIGNSSGRKVDKFSTFGLTKLRAARVKPPLIAECFANLECKVTDKRLVKKYNLFVLEVLKALIDPAGDETVLTTIFKEAKAYMVRTTPVGLMSHHFNAVLNEANFDVFYRAPVLILISTVAEMPWAVEDCPLAAENLMLAARAARLGTCWIGFAQGWLGTHEGKALLKLPTAYKPVAPTQNRILCRYREKNRKSAGWGRNFGRRGVSACAPRRSR